METVEAMKDAGIYNTTSAGVEQTRAAYAQVLASLPSMRQSIRETENALCLMLNQPAQEIERGVLKANNYRQNSLPVFLCNCYLTVPM